MKNIFSFIVPYITALEKVVKLFEKIHKILQRMTYYYEFTARLLENGGRYQAQYLIPMNLPRLTPDTVDVIFDTYKTDLRCDIVMF
jgi:hypothetical protein